MYHAIWVTGATYERLMNIMFKDHIDRTIEVYVDNMLVKSKSRQDHIGELRETFEILRKYRMNVNPKKYAFRVSLRQFLGFIIIIRE